MFLVSDMKSRRYNIHIACVYAMMLSFLSSSLPCSFSIPSSLSWPRDIAAYQPFETRGHTGYLTVGTYVTSAVDATVGAAADVVSAGDVEVQ